MNHSIYLIKQAWAGLKTNKNFMVTVVATLGSTLGALLCILTLAYVVILKPLPYPEQEKLFQLDSHIIEDGKVLYREVYNYPTLIHLYENQTLFSETALVTFERSVVSSLSTQPSFDAIYVTPNYFTILDSKMTLGRAFEKTEEKDTYNPVVILSYEFWQNEFSGDSTILEQTVTIGNTNFRVIGVLAESFIEPQIFDIGRNTDIFLPWDFNAIDDSLKEGFGGWRSSLRIFGKLDSQLSIAQIEQKLTIPTNEYWRENVLNEAQFDKWSHKIALQPFKQVILGDTTKTVLLLLAGVIGLILIACANITNLFMSRTADQQRELAINAAVGASKRHIFQALFAQSALIVSMAVVLALIVANIGCWLLQHYLAGELSRVEELAINSITVSIAFIIALALGLFFAKISSNMINYRALNATLQSSGKGTGIQVSQSVRKWLVISQVTIVTLLVVANLGLLKDSLGIIYKPLGFETDDISTLRLKVVGNLSSEEIKPLSLELKNKLMALPQVADVSLTVSPFSYHGGRTLTSATTEERFEAQSKYIDDRYFPIMEQTLLEGDFFTTDDFTNDNQRIIINDVFAEKLAPNGSALGKKLTIFTDVLTVIGVVKSVKMPTETDVPIRAFMRNGDGWNHFVIKLKPNQTLSRELVVTLIKDISSQLFVGKFETINEQRNKLLSTHYITAITSVILTVLSLFLATIGLYGVLSYATKMRRFELGTRIAIGAKRTDIINLIIKDNAGAVGIGFVISLIILLGLAIGFSDALASYINLQLISLFSITLLLISVMSLFTCYWPLRAIINKPVIHSLRGSQ